MYYFLLIPCFAFRRKLHKQRKIPTAFHDEVLICVNIAVGIKSIFQLKIKRHESGEPWQ